MCKSLTNYFPRNNDFLVTYFGKTQICNLMFSRANKKASAPSKAERAEAFIIIIRK